MEVHEAIIRVTNRTVESTSRLHLMVMFVSIRVSAFFTCCDPYEVVEGTDRKKEKGDIEKRGVFVVEIRGWRQ